MTTACLLGVRLGRPEADAGELGGECYLVVQLAELELVPGARERAESVVPSPREDPENITD